MNQIEADKRMNAERKRLEAERRLHEVWLQQRDYIVTLRYVLSN